MSLRLFVKHEIYLKKSRFQNISSLKYKHIHKLLQIIIYPLSIQHDNVAELVKAVD